MIAGLNLKIEKRYWQGRKVVVGVDEVGRGALAGPLTVAAVCFPPMIVDCVDKERFLINNSKKIYPPKRKSLALWIKKHSLISITRNISQTIIDRKGIVYAFEKGVITLIKEIKRKIRDRKLVILIDGFLVKKLNLAFKESSVFQQALINGDERCFSIAAASIIAKVYRDSLMTRLSKKYLGYHFEKNKGYGTKEHFKALKKYGLTKIHRRTFLKKFFGKETI